MDKNNISFQVLSHGPGSMDADQCRSSNDQMFEAVKANPDRFAAFAVLPVSDPASCADELTRCVKELGFVGALIDNHTKDGTYFDGEDYIPMFRAAQDLDVPIYLHPTWPYPQLMSTLYTGNFSDGASRSISASGFGWHSDVATHVLRLFASGLFDTFPRLKIIIGHMGEMLPGMLERIIRLSKRWGERQRDFKMVWDQNIWITTSGNWSVDPMATILRNTRLDRILFSVDYPFGKNEEGLWFMQELEKSGLVDQKTLEDIAYRNAESLLGVKAKKVFG
jgi:predicted TIM-barrel fold metal-dependent hydrolase